MALEEFSLSALEHFLERLRLPKFRYKQLEQAYFKEKCLRFEELTTFSSGLRRQLIEKFGPNLLPLRCLRSEADEQTRKFLFELQDGKRIESVYMRFQSGLRSLCLSTQVGCTCGCAFCATGGIGFQRQLTAEEILFQVLYVSKTTDGVDRITVMGMGEALLNPNIYDALHLITEKFQFSPHRISVSTVGIIPGIKKLTQQYPQITLTLSLHFPNPDIRAHWMPMTKQFPIDRIFEALDERARLTNHKIYLAYLVIDKVNNRSQDLEDLEAIFEARGNLRYLYHLNLIPFHPIPDLDLPATDPAIAQHFQKELEKRHIPATVRQSFGKSIRAACGQLAAEYSHSKNASNNQ